MRTVIITILVWALLIGFLVGGVKAISTAPSVGTVGAVSENTGNQQDLQRVDIDRANLSLSR